MLNYPRVYPTLAIGMTSLATYHSNEEQHNHEPINAIQFPVTACCKTGKNRNLAKSFPTMSNLSRWCRVMLYHRHIAFTRPTKSSDLYTGWKFPKIFDDGNSASAASNRVNSSSTSRKANVCCSWQSLQYIEKHWAHPWFIDKNKSVQLNSIQFNRCEQNAHVVWVLLQRWNRTRALMV